MTGSAPPDRAGRAPAPSGTLVWIDAREALIVRWHGGRAQAERLDSDVPAHHRATGHVRHDSTLGHASGGRSQTAGEPKRLEHLERFIERVAVRLSPGDDILILGSGDVHERLARHVRAADTVLRSTRAVTCEASTRLTEPQLIARLRHHAGADAPRRTPRLAIEENG